MQSLYRILQWKVLCVLPISVAIWTQLPSTHRFYKCVDPCITVTGPNQCSDEFVLWYQKPVSFYINDHPFAIPFRYHQLSPHLSSIHYTTCNLTSHNSTCNQHTNKGYHTKLVTWWQLRNDTTRVYEKDVI